MDRPSPSKARREPEGTSGGTGGPSEGTWASGSGGLPPASGTSGGPATSGTSVGAPELGDGAAAASPAAEAGVA
eukprot:9590630-Alexandrium_andersonii.AAC.1